MYVVASSATIAGTLTIPVGKTLAFGAVDNVTLSAKSIVVEGTLQLGTEGCPLSADGAIITLTGAKPAESPDTTKGIYVAAGGVLDMHGSPVSPTWTRLAATAFSGATTLELQESVAGEWKAGDEVVVITTRHADFDASDHQNEIRTVVSVTGSTVTLSSALAYDHWAGDEYQGEVGLLTRSITVQGDALSEDDAFGGHVKCVRDAICRVSFVLAYRMGAQNVIGSYPFHFHLMGSVGHASYVRGSAIHRSYFRALVIHGTSNLTLSCNVAYNIAGSAVYMEDGVEMDNLVEFNLVAHVLPIDGPAKPYQYYDLIEDSVEAGEQWHFPTTSRAVPVDITPAGFYCPNQRNRWVGNTASGGFAGFYFPAVPYVLGKSRVNYTITNVYETDFSPVAQHGLEFDSNTIHSSGQYWEKGGCFYSGGVLMTPTSSDTFYAYNFVKFPLQASSLTPSFIYPDINRGEMLVTNSKIWGCGNCLLAWGTQLAIRPLTTVDGAEFSDCKMGLQFFAHNIGAHLLFTAHTNNSQAWGGVYVPATAFKTYDMFMQTIFTDVKLRGFKGPQDTAFLGLVTDDNSAQEGFAGYHMIDSKDATSTGLVQLQRGHWCEDVAIGTSTQKSLANTGGTNMSLWDWDAIASADAQNNPATGSATAFMNLMDLDGSISGVGAPDGAILGAADCPSQDYINYRVKDWWKVDESSCELKFPGHSNIDSGDSVDSGLWACPRKPDLIARPWATVPRSAVEIRFRRDTTALAAPEDAIPATELTLAEYISGIVYHWGNESKYAEMVWRWMEPFDCAYRLLALSRPQSQRLTNIITSLRRWAPRTLLRYRMVHDARPRRGAGDAEDVHSPNGFRGRAILCHTVPDRRRTERGAVPEIRIGLRCVRGRGGGRLKARFPQQHRWPQVL